MVSSFYHKYVIWKSSVFYDNVSTSPFKYILNIFVCISLYLCFFFKNIFNFINYLGTLNFIIDILEKNLRFLNKNVSTWFFDYTLIVFVCLPLSVRIITKKLKFFNLSYEFPLLYQECLIINLQFCQKMSPLHFQLCDNYICMPIIVS